MLYEQNPPVHTNVKGYWHSNLHISFVSCHAPHNHLSFTSDLIFWPHLHDRISEPWRLEKAATGRSLNTSHYLPMPPLNKNNTSQHNCIPRCCFPIASITIFFPYEHGRVVPGWPSDRRETLLGISIYMRGLSTHSNHGIYPYSFWILTVIKISEEFVHDLSLAARST